MSDYQSLLTVDHSKYPLPKQLRCGNGAIVRGDGLTVEHRDGTITVLSDRPILPQHWVYYFEMRVVKQGDTGGDVVIGLVSDGGDEDKQTPSIDKRSIGYYSSKGIIYADYQQTKIRESLKFSQNDTAGCLVDFQHQAIMFTKNGEVVKRISTPIDRPLYPVVASSSPGTKIRVNFGASPFRFHIWRYIEHAKMAFAREVAYLVPEEFAYYELCLIYGHLISGGYYYTAKELSRTCKLLPLESLPALQYLFSATKVYGEEPIWSVAPSKCQKKGQCPTAGMLFRQATPLELAIMQLLCCLEGMPAYGLPQPALVEPLIDLLCTD